MLEKFLVLLERFVVAHELIAANSGKEEETAYFSEEETKEKMDKFVEEKKKEVKTAPKKAAPKKASKPEPEDDDLEDDEPPVKKGAKKKAAKPEVDLSELRAEIKMMAGAVGEGDNDDCADDFDALMDEYDARTISKISDEDVVAFHADLKKLVSKYYEIED